MLYGITIWDILAVWGILSVFVGAFLVIIVMGGNR